MRKKLFLLLLVILFISIGCKEQIVHDLSESEANHLLTRLHESDISSEKQVQSDGQWAIAVDRGDVLEALSKLSNARVLRRAHQESNNVAGSGMLPSREAQRFHHERAVSREIEVTLTALSGVLDARVHLNLPVHDPLLGKRAEKSFIASGSALVITDSNFKQVASDIASIVSGASGINAEQVSVLITSEGVVEEEDRGDKNIVSEAIAVQEVSRSKGRSYKPFLIPLLVIIVILFLLLIVKRLFKTQPKVKAPHFEEQLRGMMEVV